MMKKALAVLSVFSLSLALAACGGTASSSSSSLAAPSSSSVASSSSKVASVASSSAAPSSSSAAPSSASGSEAKAAAPADLGDSLAEPLKISLDGVVFSFPGSTFADFEAAGWTIDPKMAGTSLPPKTASSVSYSKGSNSIAFGVRNTTDAEVPIEETTCSGIALTKRILEGVEVGLPGGITFGASPEEVEAAYGGDFNPFEDKNGELIAMEYEFSGSRFTLSFLGIELRSIDVFVK